MLRSLEKNWPFVLLYAFAAFVAVAAPHEVTIDGVRYVPATLPTTQPGPSTVPAPVQPTVVVVPTGVHVKPGESWVSAVRSARPGDTVWLAPGVYTEALIDAALRLDRVTINGAGATIRVPDGSAVTLYRPKDVTITGIRFEAMKPTGKGIVLLGAERVTVADCVLTGFTFGATIEPSGKNRSADVTFSRCDITGNWNPTGQDSSGIYAQGCDRLTIDHCSLTENGWKPGKQAGSIRNHNFYCAGDNIAFKFTNNRSERASSHGLQARAGGVIEGNAFTDNPIHLSYGLVNGGGPITPGGVFGSVKGNTFTGTRLLAGSPRGWSIECGNVKDADITGNKFDGTHTFDPTREQVAAIKTDVCRLSENHPQAAQVVKIKRLRIEGNTGRWPGGLLRQGAKADELTVQAEFK